VTLLPIRRLIVLAAGLAAVSLAGCSRHDTAPPVATVSFRASKPSVTLGSPVDLTYRFDVAPSATISGDYRVFVHVNNADGQTLWSDDHDPPVPTSQWKPGQKIEYTRTRFVPVVPYLGAATVQVGLYRDNSRLPLQGPDPADRNAAARAYTVGTLQLLPSSDNIFVIYSRGWHPDEFAPEDPSTSWKWTQKSAVMSVRNPKTDVTLYLEYDARPDLFAPTPQIVTVSAGDQVVATFPADSGAVKLRRIPITAAQMGTAETTDLRLDVDKTFVPARLPAGGKDTRELGIRVYHAFVEGR
jgi:hypothetical protein